MFFKKKSRKNEMKCENCNSEVEERFNYCPYCRTPLFDKETELKNYGMLGKDDVIERELAANPGSIADFGIADKIIGSLVNSLVKNLDKQFKEMEKSEIKNMPNGIKISIGHPQTKKSPNSLKKTISEEQLKKMSSLPRVPAKTNIKRLSDKVIYELTTPGVESNSDIFVSKLESGYEVKAIGDKKIYVNSLPIDLPLKGFSVDKNRLSVEFKLQEE